MRELAAVEALKVEKAEKEVCLPYCIVRIAFNLMAVVSASFKILLIHQVHLGIKNYVFVTCAALTSRCWTRTGGLQIISAGRYVSAPLCVLRRTHSCPDAFRVSRTSENA